MKNSSNFVLELAFWKLLSIIVFVGIGILCTRVKSDDTETQSHKVDSTYVEDTNTSKFTQTIDGVHFVSPSGAEPGTDTYTIELIKANNPDWTWEQCEKFMWENN